MEKRSLRVLLIEDDEEDAMLLREQLSTPGAEKFQIEWVNTYEAGVRAVRHGDHDAVLLDYRLGERDGLDFLREVNERYNEKPIILLTGQGGYNVDVDAMAAGAADYLVKGQIPPELLERSIRYSVERKHTEIELRKHRDHLEEMVRQRTEALETANRELQREIDERRKIQAERERLIGELREALAKVKLLSGFLPICAHCKKIRNDQGYWQQIEAYIRDHSEAEFSHSICPECIKEHYPEFCDEV
jgi:DNA-binding response OmpR family regulator